MTMERCTTISCLPREMLVDIITRLPIEDLSRCRFVNKDWKNLFTDPNFIELCNSRINKDDPIFLVLCQTSRGGLSELYLVNNENHDTKLTAMKIFLHAQLPKGKIQIIGSCNGLICLWCSGYFYICNPLIGEIFKLKEYYNSYLGSSGFGFDASTNTYKVVHTSGFRDSHRLFQTGVEIYTLGSGTWRKINNDIPACFYVWPHINHAVLVHGALHWQIRYGREEFENCQIVAIDIEAETFRALKIPTRITSSSAWSLTSLGERLSLVEKANDQTIVWIMHDYGNQESWTKEYIVDRELLEPLHISLKLLRMVKNDRILFHGHNGEGYYDVTKNERMKHFHIHGLQLNYVNLDVVVHYGSLNSPGRLAKS